MKTIVLGKVMKNEYSVNSKTTKIVEDGKEKIVYTGKPVLIKNPEVKEWKEICSFDGGFKYNTKNCSWNSWYLSTCINISEDEAVCVTEEIFRADLNELHLRTDKVLEEIEINKEKAEKEFDKHIYAFNKMMNTSNKAMQDYCDLHHLNYGKSDCEKVFNLVYPDNEFEIKDGKMSCKPKYTVTASDFVFKNDAFTTVCNGSVDTCTATISSIDSRISALETKIN